jgi:dTDP-4-dehydrorhamnose 3,5-epimerase
LKLVETNLPGVTIIEPVVHGDERGFFLETYRADQYLELIGPDLTFVQDNHSRSDKGILRGLHAQHHHPQGKLVRVTRGSVFDVAVDIDPQSQSCGQWFGVELTDYSGRQLWIPPGYAHGFVVLSESADFEYKCTDYYHPEDEIGVLWNDPEIGIDWPVQAPQLSAKDAANPPLREMLGTL